MTAHPMRRLLMIVEGVDPTGSPKFRAWFRNSQVVDDHGAPLVVYHGTQVEGGFDSFDHTKIGKTDEGYLGKGFYFGSTATANVYAGSYREAEHGHVMPVYLSVQRPLVLHARFNGRREVDRAITVRDALNLPHTATASQVTDAAKAAGYDGIVYDLRGDREFCVFAANQVKSVFAREFEPSSAKLSEDTTGG